MLTALLYELPRDVELQLEVVLVVRDMVRAHEELANHRHYVAGHGADRAGVQGHVAPAQEKEPFALSLFTDDVLAAVAFFVVWGKKVMPTAYSPAWGRSIDRREHASRKKSCGIWTMMPAPSPVSGSARRRRDGRG